MRRKIFLTGILMLCIKLLMAQTVEVSGRVVDASGNPIPGVSVTERGSRKGTSTDMAGHFKIMVKPGTDLIFSSVGFDRQTVSVSGNTMSITMVAGNDALSEVVVTALGIKKEKKALGYAVATVDDKALELRPEGDVGRLLAGKAPGVNILASSGLSGSGTSINIRGISSLTGGNQPLFVVDGVPFDASTNSQYGFTQNSSTSSRFLDLDPNNIENISVLKGLSASVLYGELGRNGVILVTTKNGSGRKPKKGLEITASQSLFVNEVANLPEYTDNWGAGFENSVGAAFYSNWGGRLEGQEYAHPYSRAALNAAFPEYVGAKAKYVPYNSVENFFRQGLVNTTALNVSGSGNNTTFNANFGYLDDLGFTPGNRLIRNTLGMGGTAKLNNNFTLSGTINFVKSDMKTPPNGTSFGSGSASGSVFGDLIYTPRNIDLMGWPYQNPIDGSSVYYRGGNDIQNPRWTVNNAFVGNKVQRTYGNLMLKYDIMKGLNVSYRFGYDNYSENQFYSVNKGAADGYPLGIHQTSDAVNQILNHDVIANFVQDITDDIDLNVDAGINSVERSYSQNGLRSTNQLVFGLFDHDNFVNYTPGGLDYKVKSQSIGAFANATLGYRQYLYLNLGGRNSWSSTLEKENRSLFYPSVSLSFIPTSAFAGLQNSSSINYLKFRVGLATSARFPSPYNTRPSLVIGSQAFVDRAGNVVNTNQFSTRLPNSDLKPELLKEYEAGVEARFFDSRVNIDLTFYKRITDDQILDRDLDPSTGFTVTSINAGSSENKGIELGLGYNVVRSRDWNLQLDGVFTLNRGKVTQLPEGVERLVLTGFTNLGNFAVVGEPINVIMGSSIVREEKSGGKLVDPSGDYAVNNELTIIGDPNPDYKLSGIGTLSYKSLSFRMQWDFTKGGDIYSRTAATLLARGVTKDTDFDRYQTLILAGVDANGEPNTVQSSASGIFFNQYLGADETNIFDATLLRLREASLSYSLDEKILKRTPFGAISFTLSGQNLWYDAPNLPKYTNVDPETNSLGVSNGAGFELLTGPTSRRYGASIRVSF